MVGREASKTININFGTEKSLTQQYSRILNIGFSRMMHYNRISTRVGEL